MKNYLGRVIADSTTTNEEADAVEYAIFNDWVKLTYDLGQDVAMIQRQLLTIVEHFRRVCLEHEAEKEPAFNPTEHLHYIYGN